MCHICMYSMCGCIMYYVHMFYIQVRSIVYSSAMLALCYYMCTYMYMYSSTVRCIHRIHVWYMYTVLSISEYYI